MSHLWAELKRRNVIRVGLAYVIGAWLLLQVGDVLVGLLSLPEWSLRLIALLLLLGLPVCVAFAWIYELTPEGVRRAEQVEPGRSITGETGSRLNLLTFVLALGLVGFVLIDRFVLERQSAGPSGPASAGVSSAHSPRQSIAVLPFVNMSSDAENEYFSDGISEELLNVLARLPLRVAARTSSFQFKGQNLDIGEIGRKLGVDHVLEGSVRKAGGRVRITAQLIHTADGFHLWSQTWERELENVFAVQTEIAEKIAAALQVRLAGGTAQLTSGYTASSRAYELYLLGRHHFARRNRADLEVALAHFSSAIEIDPAFALAYVGQADATIFLQDHDSTYGALPYDEVVSRAKPALQRALELEPDLAEAHASLGLLISTGPNGADSLGHFQRAVELKPNYALAQMWFGLELLEQRQFRRASEAFESAVRLDPLTPVVLANRSLPLMIMGQREAAESALNELIALAPDAPFGYTYLAFVNYLWGDLGAAYGYAMRGVERQDVGLSRTIAGLTQLALDDPQGAAQWLVGANRGVLLAAHGDWDELVRLETARLESTAFAAEVQVSLGQAEMQRGNFEQALRHYLLPGVPERVAREALYPGQGSFFYSSLPALDLAHLYLKLGRETEAREVLKRCRDFIDQMRANGAALLTLDYLDAGYYAINGQPDEALDALSRAIAAGWRVPWLMRIDLNLQAIRGTPRFGQLLDEITRDVERQRLELGL